MRTRVAVLVVAAMAVALSPAVPAGATLGPAWTSVPAVPMPASGAGAVLRGVAALSEADVWAVGAWRDKTGHALVAHWDGTGWTVPTTPQPAGPQAAYSLEAVDATAATDVWAAGAMATTAGSTTGSVPLVLHYDGTGWTAVPAPGAPAAEPGALNDVDMLSKVDGWAVGERVAADKGPQAQILRWQAGRWAEVPLPRLNAVASTLSSVYASGTADVWAVGSQTRLDGSQVALVLHWDGVEWREGIVPVPARGESEHLSSVAALPAGDVWAAGRTCIGPLPACRPLALRLTGGVWQRVPTAGGGTELTEVVPRSATDVWVTGYGSVDTDGESDYAEHWDGTRFTADADVPSINGEPASALQAAAATPDTGQLWAVGWQVDPEHGRTHAMRRG
jgi:hypothetical protein